MWAAEKSEQSQSFTQMHNWLQIPPTFLHCIQKKLDSEEHEEQTGYS